MTRHEAWLVLCAYIAECPVCEGMEMVQRTGVKGRGRRDAEYRDRRRRLGTMPTRIRRVPCPRCRAAVRLAEHLRPGARRVGPVLFEQGLTRRRVVAA